MYIHTRDSWIRFLPLTTQNPKWSENNGLWLTVGDNEVWLLVPLYPFHTYAV